MSESFVDAEHVLRRVLNPLRSAALGSLLYAAPFVLLKRSTLSSATLKSAAAFGVFAGVFRAIRNVLDDLRAGSPRDSIVEVLNEYSAGISGFIAAFALVATDNSFASSLFVIWCFLKSMSPLVLPSIKSAPWMPLAITTLATTIALPAGYRKAELHHPSYSTFLHSWVHAAGVKLEHWNKVLPGKSLSHRVHPDMSLARFMVTRIFTSTFIMSCKLYAPLYVLWSLPKFPHFDVASTTVNFSRSVLFLASYVSCLWAGILIASLIRPGRNLYGAGMYSWLWIPSLCVLFERPRRQLDLGIYIMAHAVNSIYRGLKLRGDLRPNTFVGALLLGCSAAATFHSWRTSPKSMKVVRMLFGPSDLEREKEQKCSSLERDEVGGVERAGRKGKERQAS